MSTMCQGFSYFIGFLHHFVLAKLATTSIRIKQKENSKYFEKIGKSEIRYIKIKQSCN